jgi:hypothetical protein
MKTFLTAAILGLTSLAGAAGASADDGCAPRHHDSRVESRTPYRHQVGNYRRHWWQFWAPRAERVWVPARYESRIAGYDHCGKPIYRSVCVCEGYWTTRRACD